MVRRAIDALPPHYRAVVVLRDIEELSNEEAAEVLGEPVSAIKSRLHRARMALREQLTRLMTTDKGEVSDEEDDSFIAVACPHDEPGDGSAA
jgi:RNA polymerase sigma-70 factor, ECF subfamily